MIIDKNYTGLKYDKKTKMYTLSANIVCDSVFEYNFLEIKIPLILNGDIFCKCGIHVYENLHVHGNIYAGTFLKGHNETCIYAKEIETKESLNLEQGKIEARKIKSYGWISAKEINAGNIFSWYDITAKIIKAKKIETFGEIKKNKITECPKINYRK